MLYLLFFATALLYASVGFGGGSTYNALLVLTGMDYRLIPVIALGCNIIVVSGGVYRFAQQGHLQVRRLLPFVLTSVPAAWVGGRIPVSEQVFTGLLGVALLVSGVRLLTEGRNKVTDGASSEVPWVQAGLIGTGLGLLAGMVGIGGGVFLAPLLYFWRWGSPRQIAAACSFFILVNSIAGMAGQVMKLEDLDLLGSLSEYWPLIPAVLVGGQLGSWLGSTKLNPVLVKRMTAILILYVALRLFWHLLGSMDFE